MDLFNHTRRRLADIEDVLGALKVMLYGAGYAYDPTETSMVAVAAEEVSGNGWAPGGETIANAAVGTTNTNESALTGDPIIQEATGGDIGPAAGMVVFDSTGADATAWKPLFRFHFPAPQTAGVGTDFKIGWSAEGIHVWVNP